MPRYVLPITMFVWVAWGLVWLFPRKLRLMRRLGHLRMDEVIQLGKNGDVEAAKLHQDSKRLILVGLVVLLPQVLWSSI